VQHKDDADWIKSQSASISFSPLPPQLDGVLRYICLSSVKSLKGTWSTDPNEWPGLSFSSASTVQTAEGTLLYSYGSRCQ